jgi:tetratricopeptide (TPR) repeat protein
MLFCACAAAPVEEKRPIAKAPKGHTPTKSEIKSLEVFNEILEIVESSEDKTKELPRIEKLYLKIIKQYPDAPLAHESYWRLITIYVDEYTPPQYRKAESLYREFSKKYPKSSFFKGMIADSIGKHYHRDSKWGKLLELSNPFYERYAEEGIRPSPSLMFMYSEANLNLGNIAEAEEGYRILMELYPNLLETKKAKERLKEIEPSK